MYNLECYRSIFEETFYMTPVIFPFLKTSSGSDGIQGMTLSWKCATKRQCPNLSSYDAFLMNNARLKTGKRSTVFPYRRSCRKQARGRIVILRHNGRKRFCRSVANEKECGRKQRVPGFCGRGSVVPGGAGHSGALWHGCVRFCERNGPGAGTGAGSFGNRTACPDGAGAGKERQQIHPFL